MCSINHPEVRISKGEGHEERREEVQGGDEQCRNDDRECDPLKNCET